MDIRVWLSPNTHIIHAEIPTLITNNRTRILQNWAVKIIGFSFDKAQKHLPMTQNYEQIRVRL